MSTLQNFGHTTPIKNLNSREQTLVLSLRRYLVNILVAVIPPTRAFGFKRFLWRLTGDTVGQGTKINGGAKVWGLGRVLVGSKSWLGMNLIVIVPEGGQVAIGANVDIGPDVLLECGSHYVGTAERRAGPERATNIEIGSGTWIGCRATLLGGARLGTGTMVAAGALVLPGEYPDNSLLAGIPAKVVRQIDESGDNVR